MRGVPNPWILIPSLLAAIGGGLVGFVVTDASCGAEPCPVAAGAVAVVSGIAAAVGVAVVVALALRSLAEWRDHADREILTEVDAGDSPSPPTC